MQERDRVVFPGAALVAGDEDVSVGGEGFPVLPEMQPTAEASSTPKSLGVKRPRGAPVCFGTKMRNPKDRACRGCAFFAPCGG